MTLEIKRPTKSSVEDRQGKPSRQLACLAVLRKDHSVSCTTATGTRALLCCAGHCSSALSSLECCCLLFLPVVVAHPSKSGQPLFHHNKQSKVSRSSSLIGPLIVHPSHPIQVMFKAFNMIQVMSVGICELSDSRPIGKIAFNGLRACSALERCVENFLSRLICASILPLSP